MTVDQAFEILGISDRNIDEISLKRAFHQAARNTHPDSNPDDENAVHKFNMINEAYNLLGTYIQTHTRQYSNENQSCKQTKDAWDYYEEADRKFAENKKKEAEARARAAMNRRAYFEQLRREKEQRESQEQEREQGRESEREKAGEQEREKNIRNASGNENQGDKMERPSLYGINLPVEMVGFSILTVMVIAQLIMIGFGQKGKTIDYANNIAIMVWWIVSAQMGYYLTLRIRLYTRDRIMLILGFLLAVEGGLGLYKIVDMALGGLNRLLAIVVLWLAGMAIQLLNKGQIIENIQNRESVKNRTTIMLLTEMCIIILGQILFVLLTLIK